MLVSVDDEVLVTVEVVVAVLALVVVGAARQGGSGGSPVLQGPKARAFQHEAQVGWRLATALVRLACGRLGVHVRM